MGRLSPAALSRKTARSWCGPDVHQAALEGSARRNDRIRGSLPSGPKAILQPLGGSSLREGPTRNRRRLGVNQPARLHRNREEVMSLLTILACILAVVLIVAFSGPIITILVLTVMCVGGLAAYVIMTADRKRVVEGKSVAGSVD